MPGLGYIKFFDICFHYVKFLKFILGDSVISNSVIHFKNIFPGFISSSGTFGQSSAANLDSDFSKNGITAPLVQTPESRNFVQSGFSSILEENKCISCNYERSVNHQTGFQIMHAM